MSVAFLFSFIKKWSHLVDMTNKKLNTIIIEIILLSLKLKVKTTRGKPTGLPFFSISKATSSEISHNLAGRMRRPATMNVDAMTRKVAVDNRIPLRNYYRIANNLLRQVSSFPIDILRTFNFAFSL